MTIDFTNLPDPMGVTMAEAVRKQLSYDLEGLANTNTGNRWNKDSDLPRWHEGVAKALESNTEPLKFEIGIDVSPGCCFRISYKLGGALNDYLESYPDHAPAVGPVYKVIEDLASRGA